MILTHQQDLEHRLATRGREMITAAAPQAAATVAELNETARSATEKAAEAEGAAVAACHQIERNLETISRIAGEVESLQTAIGIHQAAAANARQVALYYIAGIAGSDAVAHRNYQMLAPAVPSQVAHRKATLEAARREIAEIAEAHQIDVPALLVELKASRPVFSEVVWPR